MAGLYQINGAGQGCRDALDLLYIHGDVQGVLEADSGFQVQLAGALPEVVWPDGVSVEPLPEPEPMTGLEDDAPVMLAPDLVVRPPWVSAPDGFTGVDLVVPRGGAFGSGEHGSTAAALSLLHRVWQPVRTAGVTSVADVGCGSGILLAYCSARGCGQGARDRMQACDIDEPSVRATQELVPGAEVALGGPEHLRAPVHLLIANMTGNELESVWGELLALWIGPVRGSALLVSGLRPGEVVPCVERMGSLPQDRETVAGFSALVWGPDLEPEPRHRPG